MSLTIITAYQTANRCYQKKRAAKQVGILVHSTGAVNRNLKRYVDEPERLGINASGNHWNKASADKCMHAFIGYDKNGAVIVANTLPYEYACWGCGKGKNGSYNYNPTAHVQFEICQGSNTDSAYYWAAIGVAAEYCAYLCQKLGLGANSICSHREAALRGYASNHGDPESWMRYFGDTMNQFRARVAALLAGGTLDVTEGGEQTTMQTVRKGSFGPSVTALQAALVKLGFSITVDGIFGSQTDAVLRQYQAANGLEVDGECGAITWAAITAATADEAENGNTGVENVRYTVTVPNVDAQTATYLLETYAGAISVAVSPTA